MRSMSASNDTSFNSKYENTDVTMGIVPMEEACKYSLIRLTNRARLYLPAYILVIQTSYRVLYTGVNSRLIMSMKSANSDTPR